MKTVWQEGGKNKVMTSPLSLIITAFAPVLDVRNTLTPELKNEDSVLLLIDLGQGKNRLGGSVLAQVTISSATKRRTWTTPACSSVSSMPSKL